MELGQGISERLTRPAEGMNASNFHVMAKPTGAVCNLDCDYCFFLSKDQLYPGAGFRMDPLVHEAYLSQLLDAHGASSEVTVAFQGGEPTMMGLEFFRDTIALERQLARTGQRINNTIQTNGTLLTDDWGEFFREHDFLVGISIDGPAELHDAFRVDKAGKATFGRVMRGLDVLRRHGVEWNVLTTVNAANQDHGRRVYRFLRDECGAKFMQFIPIVERATKEMLPLVERAGHGRAEGQKRPVQRPLYLQQGTHVTSRTVDPIAYGRFLIEVFEEWVRGDVGRVFVQDFDGALAHWMGDRQGGVCVHAETCGLQLALEHNGDVYSCDHFVEPGYRLGNIMAGQTLREMVDSPRQRRFGMDKLAGLPDQCRRCPVRFACNGGCPKDRFAVTSDGQDGLNYLCAGYHAFFAHLDPFMKQMASLLRVRRAPAEIMDTVAASDARRGRNDPCPCGSGRKWKQCHLSAAARHAQPAPQ